MVVSGVLDDVEVSETELEEVEVSETELDVLDVLVGATEDEELLEATAP